MREFTVGLILVLLVALAGGVIAGGVTADSDDHEGEMSVVGAIETPSETVTIQGSDYDIDEIAVIEQGESIETHVTSSEGYFLFLYNTNENREVERDMSEDDSTVVVGGDEDGLDTNDLSPGTYMLALEQDYQGRQAVTPVVVQGHDIELDYPTTAEQGTEIDLEATVEPKGELDQPTSLEVAVWDDTGADNVDLTYESGTSYGGTLELDSFDAGTYNVYATVIGDETVQNYQTSTAMEAGPSLSVTNGDDSQDDESSEDSNDGNETDSGDTSAGDDPDDGDDSTETTENESSENGEQNQVLDPNAEDDSETDDTSDDDGLGGSTVIVSIVALLLAVFIVSSRSDRK